MEFLTISEVAERLRLGRSTVYAKIMKDELPHVHFGGRAIRIPSDALEDWLSRQIHGGES